MTNPLVSGNLISSQPGAAGAVNPSGATARLIAGPNNKKVLLLEVARNVSLATVSATDVTMEIDLGQFEWLGPMIDSIVPHTNTVGNTGALSWKMLYYPSYDGRVWSAGNTVFGYVSSSGYSIQTVLTPTGGFPLRMRMAFAFKNTSGSSPIPMEGATVSVTFAIYLKS